MQRSDQKRTSGEVINATLLEVFLALVFIVFALASFNRTYGRRAESSAGALRDSLATARAQTKAIGDSAARLVFTVDSFKAYSKSLPNCDPRADAPQFLLIKLGAAEILDVTVLRTTAGFTRGDQFLLTVSQFRSWFAPAAEYSRRNKCRLLVDVRDNKLLLKDDYKRMVAGINEIFRPQGYLR